MCIFLRCCLHSGKIIRVVANNAEICLNLNISTNLKPYANLHYCSSQGPRLMCFMKKSLGEKSRGTVPLNTWAVCQRQLSTLTVNQWQCRVHKVYHIDSWAHELSITDSWPHELSRRESWTHELSSWDRWARELSMRDS